MPARYPYGISMPTPMMPPGHSEEIASLGDLIDRLTARRAQQDEINRKAAVDAENQRYHRAREQAAIMREEGRNARDEARLNAQQRKEQTRERGLAAKSFRSSLEAGNSMDTAALELAPVGGSVSPEIGMDEFQPSSSPQAQADLGAAAQAAASASAGPQQPVRPAAQPAPQQAPVDMSSAQSEVNSLLEPALPQNVQQGDIIDEMGSYQQPARPVIAGAVPSQPKSNPFRETGRQLVKFGDGQDSFAVDPANIAGAIAGKDNRKIGIMQAGTGMKKDLQDNQFQNQLILDEKKHGYRMEELAARAKKKAGGKSATGRGSAMSRLSINDWTKVSREVRGEIRDNFRNTAWGKMLAAGVDRMDLAKVNIGTDSSTPAAQHMEAMMNFFGYVRGGVPAENETKQFHSFANTASNMVDKIGRFAGVSNLSAKMGSNALTPEEQARVEEQIGGLTPQERKSLEDAINVTIDELQRVGQKALNGLAQQFVSAPPVVREKATDELNAYWAHLGGQPRQWYSDVPLRPDAPGGSVMRSTTRPREVTPTATPTIPQQQDPQQPQDQPSWLQKGEKKNVRNILKDFEMSK